MQCPGARAEGKWAFPLGCASRSESNQHRLPIALAEQSDACPARERLGGAGKRELAEPPDGADVRVENENPGAVAAS
jgi:hypothetical protein